jgi:hypothetical protein
MKKIKLKHREVIVQKKQTDTEVDLLFTQVTRDIDSLTEYTIIQTGAECVKYKGCEGATILCAQNMPREIKHADFKDYKIILNEDIIFAEIIN